MSEKRTALIVFGTRPEAIKLAPLIRVMSEARSLVRPIVAVTGQHREMLDQVLDLYGLTPDVDLALMRHGQRPEEVLAAAVTRLGEVVRELAPDVVVVQGDTTTTLAGAMAGFYEHTLVGHVEAGLRSDDKSAPFPEEINRRLTTQLADLHFAPTAHARDRLLAEGVAAADIHVTGNTSVDAVLAAPDPPSPPTDERVARILADGSRYILMTAHRRENWGGAMQQICKAALDVLDAHPDLHLIFPVHRNPVVRATVDSVLGGHARAVLTEPVDYLTFVALMRRALIVLSDSGGVQEEAPSLDVPVLVLRQTTERPEALDTGAIKLVGTERARITGAVNELLDDPVAYARMAGASNPFGDGHASEKILRAIEERLARDAQTR